MRRLRFFAAFLILLFVCSLVVTQIAAAQEDTPALIYFRGVPENMTFATTEEAGAFVDFSWASIGVDLSMRLQLQALVSGEWVLLEDELSPVGELRWIAVHPLDFTDPVYRLLIVDDSENIIDEQVLTLPYKQTDTLPIPRIVSFTTDKESVLRYQLDAGLERVALRWDVINRTQTSHIIFEQVVGDETERIELPRENLWVRSEGEGVVAPVAVTDETITLQMRVVDVLDGTIYDAIFLTLPVDDTPPPTATARPTQRPTALPTTLPTPVIEATDFPTPTAEPPAILRFEIIPENPAAGQTVTVLWNLVGATSITLDVYDRDGAADGDVGTLIGRYEYEGAAGSVAFTLPPEVTEQVLFSIFANPISNGVNAALLVRLSP